MSNQYLVEPDLGFVQDIMGLGGDSLKKCFQCATCSVACKIAPENSPFPRKEMVATSWGLKDRVLPSADLWLCHQCGDCSTMCPRGAAPGDVLSAARSMAIREYSVSKKVADLVNSPKGLYAMLGVPAIIFAILAMITMNAGDTMTKIFHVIGLEWSHAHGDQLAHANFISTWFVDLVFVPLAGLVTVAFVLSLKRFVTDMHANAVLEGKTDKAEFDVKAYLEAVVAIIPKVLKHDQFNECGENRERTTSHLMVLYSFIGLLAVTSIFCVVLYIFHIPGPYSQLNPVKWVGNVSGVALILGACLMIKARLEKTDQISSYKDWYILGLVLGLGLTGMVSEMSRLAGSMYVTYFIYWVHLIFVFNLFAFLPFSKMAHLVYRTCAMAYAEYGNRK